MQTADTALILFIRFIRGLCRLSARRAAAAAAALAAGLAAVSPLKRYALAKLRRCHFLEPVKVHIEGLDVAVPDGYRDVDHEIIRGHQQLTCLVDARGVEERIEVHLVIIEQQAVHFRYGHVEFRRDACRTEPLRLVVFIDIVRQREGDRLIGDIELRDGLGIYLPVLHRRDPDALRKVLGHVRCVHKSAELGDLVKRQVGVDEVIRRFLHADAAEEL